MLSRSPRGRRLARKAYQQNQNHYVLDSALHFQDVVNHLFPGRSQSSFFRTQLIRLFGKPNTLVH